MVKGPAPQEQASFLGGCLVESDTEFEKRARKIKRHALIASIVLQILVVAALVLFPLLSKGESISAYNVTPNVPYHHGSTAEHRQSDPRPRGHQPNLCRFCAPPSIPNHIVTIDRERAIPNSQPGDDVIPGTPEGQNIPGALDAFAPRRGPDAPTQVDQPKTRTVKVSGPVQEARLVRRVQPVYPPLAIQTRREGRVELRARISTDGHVVSLEVASGDPLLIQSALNAVREWRYQPTLLGSEPVEVETYITVIYTLSR